MPQQHPEQRQPGIVLESRIALREITAERGPDDDKRRPQREQDRNCRNAEAHRPREKLHRRIASPPEQGQLRR
jgi:hypothetical protein